MMDWLRALWLRARYYVFRARFDREMEEEMRFHLELRAAEHSRAGLSEQDARDGARRRFGNRTSLEEQRLTAIGIPPLDTLGQDVRYVLRGLGPSAGLRSRVVATL